VSTRFLVSAKMGANKKIEIMAFFSNPRNDPAQKKN